MQWPPKLAIYYCDRGEDEFMHWKFTIVNRGGWVNSQNTCGQCQPNVNLACHSHNHPCCRFINRRKDNNWERTPNEDNSQKSQTHYSVPWTKVGIAICIFLLSKHQRTHQTQHTSKTPSAWRETIIGELKSPKQLTVQLIEEGADPCQKEDFSKPNSTNDCSVASVHGEGCSNGINERGGSVCIGI